VDVVVFKEFLIDDEVGISRSATAIVNPGVVVSRRERAEEQTMALVPAKRDNMGISAYYCAVGTKHFEGARGYETEPILIVNTLAGLVEKRARPVVPPAADKNLLYAEGM